MELPGRDPQDDNGTSLVRVNICGAHALSTILRATSSTTAADFGCILSTKLDTHDADKQFFSLILVHSLYEDSRVRHILRTVRPTECVLTVQRSVELKQAQRHGVSPVPSSSTSSRSSRWFFKDIRSTPLDLEGDVSGNSSSEDEEECSISDFNYVKMSEKKGYLLRRSSTDPNLWRKRWCVLGEKLWAFNNSKVLPHAILVELRGNMKLSDAPPSIMISNCVSIISPSKVHIFRAPSSEEQASWMSEIRSKVMTKTDNDVLLMAEMIICDEESARLSRVQEAVGKALDLNIQALRSSARAFGETSVYFDDSELEDPESFYACRPGIQRSASESNVHKKTHGNCLLLTRRTRTIHKELELLFGFCSAVQNYRELHRHDIRATMEPWCQWVDVVHIFDQYLDSTLENVRTVNFGGTNGYTEVKKTNLLDALPENLRETAKSIVSRIQDEILSALRKHPFGIDDPTLQRDCKIHPVQTRWRRFREYSSSGAITSQRESAPSSSTFISAPVTSRWSTPSRSFWSWMSSEVEVAPPAPVMRRASLTFDDGISHYIERADGNIYLISDKFKRPPVFLFDELTELVNGLAVTYTDDAEVVDDLCIIPAMDETRAAQVNGFMEETGSCEASVVTTAGGGVALTTSLPLSAALVRSESGTF